LQPHEARVGYAASFIDEWQNSPSYGMNQNGFPFNQIQVALSADVGSADLELRGWYQPLLANASTAGAANLSYTQWGGEALWANPFSLWHMPWLLGFRAGQEGDFARSDLNDLTVRDAWVGSLLAGPRWVIQQGKNGPWYADFLADIAPVGGRRGAGILARSYYSLPVFFGLRPAFEFEFHPVYRLGMEAGSHAWDVEVTAALSLAWVFEGGISGAGTSGRR
jgi:hypothetical protein